MKIKNLKFWILVLLWMGIIFSFSSMQQVKVSQFYVWDFFLKKLAHVSEYAILYLLIFKATGKKYILSFILTMLYAVSDEYHQSFVTGRSATPVDIGLDVSGANIAAYLKWKLQQIRQNKQKKPESSLPKS